MSARDGECMPTLTMEAETKNVTPSSPVETGVQRKNRFYFAVKRVFDFVCALLGLFILSPVLAVIAILIKAEDGGPVIHTRMCRGEKGLYKMYKFRSMCVDAHVLDRYFTPEEIEEFQREQKIQNDPRITKVGRVIRTCSLDELPQLFSVLKGDMSLVGPRPLVEEELANYADQQSKILSVKPGITGYWQVNGRSERNYESGERQRLELYYVEHCSIWLDLSILFKTISVIVQKKGAQ